MEKKPPNKRWMYALVGVLIGGAIGLVIFLVSGRDRITTFIPVSMLCGMIFALWWGERRGRIPTVEEENRPPSLFDGEPSNRK